MSKITKMIINRWSISVSIGFFITFNLALLTIDFSPLYIEDYFAIFIGSFVACLICQTKPIWTGITISFLMFLSSIVGLGIVLNSMSDEFVFPPMDFRSTIGFLLYIPVGISGAYSGAFLWKKMRGEISDKSGTDSH